MYSIDTFCHGSSSPSVCYVYTIVTALNLVYTLIFGFFAFRSLPAAGYSAVSNPNLRGPSPLVRRTFLFLVALIALTISVELVYLIYAIVESSEWIHYLLFWTIGMEISWTINLLLLSLELRRHRYFTKKISFFWVVNFVAECVVLGQWQYSIELPTVDWQAQLYHVFYVTFLIRFVAIVISNFTLLFVYPFTTVRIAVNDVENGTSELGSTSSLNAGSGSAFSNFSEKIRRLLPFLLPKKNLLLQVLLVGSFTMLILGRVVNVFVPVQFKRVVDTLTGTPGHPPRFAWDQILIFVVLRLLQGGVGLLQNIQSFMWIPIGQYTTKQISVAMFKHLHSLSLRFHITRKTGEILRVLDRGTSSIVSLLQSILFNIVPVLVDISVAVAFFITMFDIYFGIIVAVTMLGYIAATVSITEWRTKFRREMIELDNRSNQIGVDSLLNFETVKYYCAEDFETDRYSKAIDSYQIADFRSSASLNFLNTTQNFIINGGLLVGSLLCAYRVVQGVLTVGDFVLYLTYISQLYGPLNWFGTMYRMIQQNFIDMEKMLKLFEEDGDIKDAPMANELVLKGGSIVFDNVSFSYDPRHPALKNINFKIPAGSTVALVGPSGGGKSSILKLLFRFYDVKSGRILIDGQDIRSISQRSLRQAVGVVPQDTVLFNESVGYNIRYAKPTATDEEVYQAAKAAQIHEKILSFPDKYETVVGERGLRLSGGEKQRVAIARTILKDPAIILLDEATSSLDTGTERQIQAALHQLSKNRTSLVVAHRLSTIVNSDLILVIKDGMVIDQGTHEQLLKKEDGLYHQLWHQQLKEENN